MIIKTTNLNSVQETVQKTAYPGRAFFVANGDHFGIHALHICACGATQMLHVLSEVMMALWFAGV